MDKSAVKEVFEDFEENATDVGPDDLPTLDVDETITEHEKTADQDDVQEALDNLVNDAGGAQQPAATDGGEPQ